MQQLLIFTQQTIQEEIEKWNTPRQLVDEL